MWRLKATAAALLLARPSLAHQKLASCPSGENRLTTSSGAYYAVCEEADFQGATVQTLDTVATVSDCAQACERQTGCTRAVYDSNKSECYLKGSCSPALIAAPADYLSKLTTIKYLHTFQAGDEIASCISTQANMTTTVSTCGSTDFVGKDKETLEGVASLEACASACGRSASCAKAVYKKQTSQCFIKDDATELVWTYQPGCETIHHTGEGEGETTTPVEPQPSTTPVSSSAVPSSTQPASSATSSSASAPTETPIGEADPVSKLGRWSNLIEFPIIPVAAYMVPAVPVSSKILMFSSWGDREFGGEGGKTQFAEYDMATGEVSKRTIANTHHDMFCPGISALADGRIVISGGSNAADVSIYDPVSDAFTKAADMQIPRGYQSSATLSDGRVFTIGGSYSGGRGGKTGEVYDAATNTWTLLPGTDPKPILTVDHEGIWREDNHAWLFPWRNGSVFQAGPSRAMNWFLTEGEGTHVPAGNRGSSMDQMCGINIMYDVGKILSAGGSQDYTNSMATKEAHVIEIGNTGEQAIATATSDMHFARGFANAVVLPGGQVLVTGGQKKSLVFTDTDGVLEPEVWDPKTGAWTTLAPAKIERNYHSVSVLLPDGTVFVGGGGMCYGQKGCDLAKDHLDGEIFSPPYLFARDGKPAVRPVVKDVSVTQGIRVGQTIEVTLDGEQDNEGVSFVMVRMGSATHSINTDQRRVPLTEVVKANGGAYAVTIPNDSGVVLPGPWYLFAMSKDGVPSIARTIMVTIV